MVIDPLISSKLILRLRSLLCMLYCCRKWAATAQRKNTKEDFYLIRVDFNLRVVKFFTYSKCLCSVVWIESVSFCLVVQFSVCLLCRSDGYWRYILIATFRTGIVFFQTIPLIAWSRWPGRSACCSRIVRYKPIVDVCFEAAKQKKSHSELVGKRFHVASQSISNGFWISHSFAF